MSDTAGRPARHRYAVVFLLVLALLIFVIIAPPADWSRSVALLLEFAALVVSVATSRARSEVRRTRATAAAVIGALVVIAVAAGLVPTAAALTLSGVLALAIPLSLVSGLVRLVGTGGATLQAVAGALAIYLLLGLTFAWIIGVVTHVDSTPYFSGGDERHRERARLLQPRRTDHHGFRRPHCGAPRRPRARRPGDGGRAALSRDRHRPFSSVTWRRAG